VDQYGEPVIGADVTGIWLDGEPAEFVQIENGDSRFARAFKSSGRYKSAYAESSRAAAGFESGKSSESF